MTTHFRPHRPANRLLTVLASAAIALGALGAAVLGNSAPAGAQDIEQFQSPTGNIGCMYVSADSSFPASVSCELGSYSGKVPKRPADCDVDWVASATVTKAGRVSIFSCQGDTIREPSAPILAYGRTWKRDGFTCTSAVAGMTCRAASGRGFTISRTAVKKI